MTRLEVGLFALVAAIPAAGAAAVTVVGADEVHAALVGAGKAAVVDARTAAEYEQAHIPGAINIPAARMAASAAQLPRDRGTPLIFYCRGAG